MNFKMTYRLVAAFITIMVLYSCGKDSACFKGTGKIIQEQRIITDAITAIKTEDNIDIVLTQSNVPSLTLEGGANLLPYINTEVSGNELRISSDNKCGMFRDYKIPITVYISLPKLTNINYTGQGNITTTNQLTLQNLTVESSGGTGDITMFLDVEELVLKQHSGPADFTFSGSANKCYAYTLGNGWFYLNGLSSNEAHISHSGSGDVNVYASNSLLVELYSTGNINYFGNPTVTISQHSGSGSLVKK